LKTCIITGLAGLIGAEARTGKKMNLVYDQANRVGDHIWYISDTRKFQSHYPGWKQTYDLFRIVGEILESMPARL
jgi:CDP-paratose 2-epimerase